MIKTLVNYVHMTGYSDSIPKNTPQSRCDSLFGHFLYETESIQFCSRADEPK